MAKSVASITRKDLIDYYQKFYRPDNLVIAIFGDINEDKIMKFFEKKIGRLPENKIKEKLDFKEKPRRGQVIINNQRDKEQAIAEFMLFVDYQLW